MQDTPVIPSVARNLLFAAQRAWVWLRAVTEDSAYESYQTSNRGRPTLTAAEFYRQRLERKYSRPCRCC